MWLRLQIDLPNKSFPNSALVWRLKDIVWKEIAQNNHPLRQKFVIRTSSYKNGLNVTSKDKRAYLLIIYKL